MAEDSSLHDHLLRLELRLLDPSVRASSVELEALIADEFLEVGRSGRQYSRDEIIHESAGSDPAVLSIEDFEARHLGPEAAMVRYRSVAHRDGMIDEVTWRCSIWKCADGAWRITYHQGTPAV